MSAEIDTITRFSSPKKLVSIAGLCLSIVQSDDKLFMGRIKKRDTNRLLCRVLCEAANTAVRFDPRMTLAYESALVRHAGSYSRAIIVVANKMLTIMWHILKTRRPHDSCNEELQNQAGQAETPSGAAKKVITYKSMCPGRFSSPLA